MSSTEETQTVAGGCHCGAVRYTFAMPKKPSGEALSAIRCNCSFCQKLGTTNLHLELPQTIKLLSPASREQLGNYAPKVKSLSRYFCKDCATYVFMEGYFESEGKKHPVNCVFLNTVDQPQEGIELSKTKIQYFNMLENDPMAGAKDTPWPSGLP